MGPTFKAFVTVLFLSLALCQITAAEPSLKDDSLAEKIVGAIKEITTLSDNLRLETEKINIADAPRRGFLIPNGFSGITAKVSEATIAISSATKTQSSSLSDDDAKLVVETLTKFVQVHQQLLNVVIGKHSLPTLIPFFRPIRESLVQLEIVVDSFAFALIDLIPTQQTAAASQFKSLRGTISAAIETFSGPFSHGDSPVESIQAAFKDITKLSDDLRLQTLKINIVNAPLTGPRVALGFSGIIQKVDEVISQLAGVNAGLPPLSDDDAKLVVKSLTTFVQVHQALLNVVIGKHGLLTLVPFFEPIRLSLVSLETTVDTFAFYLIGLIPTQKAAAETEFGSLGITLKLAIDTYSGTYSTPFIATVE